MWDGHPLGWDEAGSEADVEPLTFEDLREYYTERYGIPNIAVFATGAFDKNEVVKWAEDAYSGMEAKVVNKREAPPMPGSKYTVTAGDSDHINIGMGFPIPKLSQRENDAATVLGAILGGGTSSRLFQQVREKNALVYSIYSYASRYSDAGYISSFMSCTGKNVEKALAETAGVFHQFLKDGVEKDELQRVKNMLKGELSRSSETTDHRIYRLCRNYMTYGTIRTTEESLAAISDLTEDDIMAVAEKFICADRLNISVLGKVGKKIQNYDISALEI